MATVVQGDFEWDDNKASDNERKHGVLFDEAVTAFFDDHALILDDPQEHEERFILVGMSSEARILYVVHAEVTEFDRTRIISARVAKRHEAVRYALGDTL